MTGRYFNDTNHIPNISFSILSGLQLPELCAVSIMEPNHTSDMLHFFVKTRQQEEETQRKLLCPPHVLNWELIMNCDNNTIDSNEKSEYIFTKESQKVFTLVCEKIMKLYANHPDDLGNLLFNGGCRNPTRDNPIIKRVVEYAHFYINGNKTDSEIDESVDHDELEEYTFFKSVDNPSHVDYNHKGYGLYGMDQQHYHSFLNKIKKQYKKQPMIDNWQFVFGKNSPGILNTPILISYYSKIQEMIQKGQYLPQSLIKELLKINLNKMKHEWQQEVDKTNRQTQEFMRKIMQRK